MRTRLKRQEPVRHQFSHDSSVREREERRGQSGAVCFGSPFLNVSLISTNITWRVFGVNEVLIR